jgi:hypothetical protein
VSVVPAVSAPRQSVSDQHRGVSPVAGPQTAIGTKVAVRNRYLGTWSAGFEVAALLVDGYSIRRTSDGAVLPAVIPFEDVRAPWGPAPYGLG